MCLNETQYEVLHFAALNNFYNLINKMAQYIECQDVFVIKLICVDIHVDYFNQLFVMFIVLSMSSNTMGEQHNEIS